MSRSYPIWHEVNACHYQSSKSYGGKSNSGETIYVGTSAKNSHSHCEILTTRREIYSMKYKERVSIFRTSIDNVVLVETVVGVSSRKVLRKRTKLNKIKNLASLDL